MYYYMNGVNGYITGSAIKFMKICLKGLYAPMIWRWRMADKN